MGYDATNPFVGDLDGNFKNVRNIEITGTQNTGIFGYSTGNVSKLRVVGATVDAVDKSAVVCGEMAGGSFDRIELDSSTININTGSGAGVVGLISGGTLSNVLTRFNKIEALSNVGVISGKMTGGRVLKAVSVVDSAGSSVGNAGGVASQASGNATIDSCFMVTKVLSGKEVYKVAEKGSSTTFRGNYSVAETKMVENGNDRWYMGIDPTSDQGGNVFFSMFKEFFDSDSHGFNAPDWQCDDYARVYPFLLDFEGAEMQQLPVDALESPAKIENRVMTINSLEGLAFIEGSLSEVDTIKLAANLEFTEDDDFSLGEGNFDPITKFEGIEFNGQGHYIKGMKINANKVNMGFVQVMENSTIKNLGLIECEVIGGSSTQSLGGLAGKTGLGTNTIVDVYVGSGRFVATNAQNVGALLGQLGAGGDVSWIIALNNTVKAKTNAGGLIGYATEGSVSNSVVAADTLSATNTSRVVNSAGATLSDNYGWNGNEKGNDPGLANENGATFTFSELLRKEFYSSKLDFIGRTAWSWDDADIQNWRCMPNLSQMTAADCEPAVVRFTKGTQGTESIPYGIESLNQLELLQAFPKGLFFELKENLNFQTADYDVDDDEDNGNWLPITQFESNGDCFDGHLDGNGYSIKGMKVHDQNNPVAGTYGVGLFGQCDPGVDIQNLSLYDFEVSAKYSSYARCAALVGKISTLSSSEKSVFKNILVKNSTIRSTGSAAAIVCYVATNIEIDASLLFAIQNSVSSSSGNRASGIAFTVNISSTKPYSISSSIAINDSVASQSGVAKRISANQYVTFSNNYAFRRTYVDGTQLPTEGTSTDQNGKPTSLLALNKSFYPTKLGITYDENFRWPDVADQKKVYHPVGKNVPNTIDSGYLNLANFEIDSDPNTFSDGTGISGDPYIVRTETDLNNMRYGVEMDYQLGNNIEITSTLTEPIGTAALPFQGNFDGNGYAIDGFSYDVQENGVSGLFGVIKSEVGSSIRNLALTNFTMSASGKNNIGILAGVDSTEEAVANTYSNILIYNGKVTGATSGVGGLFGDAPSAIIENVIVAGEGYYSSNYAGGIVGKDAKSIKNSVVIVDTIRATASNAGRITGEKLNICENVYSWYFTEAWEGGTLYDPRNPNTGIYGDNAFVTDFVDTTWWEDLGFKFSGDNSMWKLEHIDDQQVVPALKHMTDDTLTVPGLKLGIIAAGQKVITKPSHLNILHVGISDSFLYYPNESIDLRDWEDDWRLDLNGDDAGNWNPIATFKGNINSYDCERYSRRLPLLEDTLFWMANNKLASISIFVAT